MMKWALGVFVCLAAGCDLYWNNNADDVCNGGGAAIYPASELRDPNTGQCNYYGGGGGGGCPCDVTFDEGGGCAEPATGVGLDGEWAQCSGSCSGLAEDACVATAGCQAAYLDQQGANMGGGGNTFWGCWNVAPNPQEGGGCTGLDAQTCSEHDDCAMVYSGFGNATKFEQCAPESGGGTCTDVDCGLGSHCEQQCMECPPNADCATNTICHPMCVPDDACATIDCGAGYVCAEQCDAGTMNLVGSCTATCVPVGHDPGQCTGAVTCTTQPPQCPADSTAGIANGCYTGYCIPNADCNPHDPGLCYGTATCASAPPQCPSGTLPGITNGCWSGYCIPTANCEIPACETLTSESACTSRADCTPVYAGMDCTCYPGYCECNTLTYEHCQSLLMPL
jgi:hypothetical protein